MTKIRLKYVNEFRDRNGQLWRYVRRPGMPAVRLPGLPGSPEFMAAYQNALAGPVIRQRYKDRTFGNLIERYYGSSEFRNLSPSSQATYRFVLGKQVEKNGHSAVEDLTPSIAREIVESIGKPGMANLTRSVLVMAFEFAIALEWRGDNPFRRIKPYKLGSHHTWTDAELDAYRKRWPLGTRERLAFAALLWSGQRVSDVVKLKRSDVLSIKQQKTGTELSIPAHPALVRAIKAGPSNGIYIIGDKNGRPVGSETLTTIIREAVEKAGLPARCKAHGLRKAMQRILAENSATTKQMQAISGHKSLQETERYSAAANQATLAATAISLLPDEP